VSIFLIAKALLRVRKRRGERGPDKGWRYFFMLTNELSWPGNGIRRKDFTEYEKSKAMVEYVETVKETCAESAQVSTPHRGPSRTPGSYRDIEERTGLKNTTIRDAQTHVSTADAFPLQYKLRLIKIVDQIDSS
jgi:hypothetical protein